MRRSKSDKIRALADKGLTNVEIAQKTGFSAQLIHGVVKRHKVASAKVVKVKGSDKKTKINALVSKFVDDLSKLL